MFPLVYPAGRRHRKKLEEVAQLWARGDLTTEQNHIQQEADANDHVRQQLAFFGHQAEGTVVARERLEPMYLWPENQDAWRLFLAVQTQWRSGVGGCEGLDYAGVRIVIGQRRSWRKHARRRLLEVQIMERAVLRVWAKPKAPAT